MIQIVTIDEAQDQLRALLAQALNGGEVVITEDGKPVARLAPLTETAAPPQKKRIMGLHRGQIWVSEDFDDPLPDEFWLGEE